MDAFDYFLLVFVITDVAKDFGTTKTSVAVATTLTLAARPVGAAIFGYWADRKGRRLPLLVDVLFYSLVEFLTRTFGQPHLWGGRAAAITCR